MKSFNPTPALLIFAAFSSGKNQNSNISKTKKQVPSEKTTNNTPKCKCCNTD